MERGGGEGKISICSKSEKKERRGTQYASNEESRRKSLISRRGGECDSR